MANIKSAKKRIKTSEKRAAANKSVRSAVKTEIKKVRTAVEGGDKAAAQETLKSAVSAIMKAGSKGVYPKNAVARKVARLSAAVDKMA